MAHVHGAASAAQTGKHAAHAAHGAHAAHSAHAAHGAHAAHAHHALQAAAPAAVSFHNVAKGAAATGALATARTPAGKSFLGRVFSHPVVLFGLGVAVGYAIHKYRKEIIHSANRAAEKSQDFILQQRENLEDLVAEAPESEG
jgi:hypothetical protein